MKKRTKKGKGKLKGKNEDLPDIDSYDVSESDDGLDDDDRILLDNARGRKKNKEQEEVLRVYESSEDDEEEMEEDVREGEAEDGDGDEDEEDDDMASDFEGRKDDDDGDLPNSKAWGSRKRNYYDTDYVDKDYLGFDDEEAALMEEREANEIQKRLLAELEGADFSLGLLESVEEKKQELSRKAAMDVEEEQEKVAKDLSKLSNQELREILKRESPGYLELMEITKEYCAKMKKYILPMASVCEKLKIPECPATKLLNAYKDCCSIFMLNVSFFINIKLAQVPNADRHPVVNIVGQYLTLLRMMDNLMRERGTWKQIKRLVRKDAKGVDLVPMEISEPPEEVAGKNRKERRHKKRLMLLQKKQKYDEAVQEKEKKITWKDEVEVNTLNKEIERQLAEKLQESEHPPQELHSEEEDNDEDDEEQKRPITFQMLKNKGLTPKRKKEVRNPRVRNKNKFKKAVKNRRGQVRTVRKEVSKYGGETSGINKFVAKGIKLK